MTSVQQRGRHALADTPDTGSADLLSAELASTEPASTDPLATAPGLAEATGDDAHSAFASPSHPLNRRRRLLAGAALVLFLAAVVTTTVFALTGGRYFVVRTPSMGTTAPVGALVLTRPTTVADLHVGDVVAFHPATMPASTYTHRVVAIDGASITTRGDINGADDPWRTTDRDLIGRTVAMLPGVGYALRALPLIAGGSLVLWGITRWWVPARFRGPARMLGGTALYLAAALTIRPYVGVVQLAAVSDGDRNEVAAVSTGILPVQLVPLPGHGTAAPVSLRYGEVGTAVFSNPPADGKFALTAQLHLTGWDWVIVGAMWSLPLLWTMLVGFKRPDTSFEVGIDRGATPAPALALA